MKKTIMLLFALLLATGMKADETDTLAIDAIYKELLARPGVTQTAVRYTGGWGAGCANFSWLQGEGSGWTVGNRLTLKGVDKAEADRIMQVFKKYHERTHVAMGEGRADMGLERFRMFYGMRWSAGTLYFLKARKLGNEFCVPFDWFFRDYYKPKIDLGDAWAAIDAPTRRLLGLSHLWSGVKQNFVFMNRVSVDWDSLYVAMIPKIKAAANDEEATRLLQRMAATLHDGHTFVYSDYPQDLRTMPLTTRWIDGKVYVDQVLSSAFARKGVRRGLQVVAVNGEAPEVYAQRELAPYVSSSTPQWLIHNMYDDKNLTKGGDNRQMTLTLSDGKREVSVGYNFDGSGFDIRPQQNDVPIRFSLLKGGVGYLRIDNFMDGRICREFDKLYPQILQTRALIIDVRDNPGGNSGNGDHVARHFIAQSLRAGAWESREYIPAFASWRMAERVYRQEGSLMTLDANSKLERYTKPVALLVNRGTFSAAEDFTALLRATGHCALVGEPTGGSTGNGVRIAIIPGVCTANICSKHDYAPDGYDFVGKGFVPDIAAPESYKTYFKDKQDNAMTKALQWLNKQIRK